MKIRFYGIQGLRTFVACFVLLLSGLTSLTSQAQVGTPTYFSATPTTSTNSFPLNTTASNKVQWIYAPGVFSTTGAGTGTPVGPGNLITKLYIRIQTVNASTVYQPNFEISMKQGVGTGNSFGSGTYLTGMTTVYQSNAFQFTGITTGSWYGIVLQTPFAYNPSESLVIEVKSNLSVSGGNSVNSISTTGVNQRIFGAYASATGTAGTGLTPMGIDVIPGVACTNPPTAGTATASPNVPVCATNPVGLNLTGSSTGSGLTYEWESSLTGGGVGFSSLGAPQSTPLFNIAPTVTKFYRCKVVCSGGSPVFSSEVQVQVLPGLPGGTYTINSTLPAGGSNFQSFTAAVAALSCGITGPVVFNVGPGPTGGNFNEQIVIPFIGGSSPTNTITFNGNGRTLYFGSTNTNARYVLQLNGAKYVTINNLNIDASTGTFGWGIHFIGSADFNTITNCIINTDIENTTSGNFHCVVMSNSNTSPTTSGTNGNFNTLIGNTFIGGYYTVVLYGNSAAGAENLNNKVINNTFMDSYSYTLYMAYQKNDTISGNDFSRPSRTSSTTTAAIFLTTGCSNTLVEKNKVHNYFDQMTTNTSTCYTFYLAADGTAAAPNRYINNLVYNMNGNGTLYGIYNTTAPYLKAYHNTIVHNFTDATAGATYGFYQTGTAAGLEYKNNIIVITRGGSGEKIGLDFTATGSTIVSNNNNVLINSAGSGAQAVGEWGTTLYTTMANWQTANSGAFDAQSQSVNPAFVNPATGNYKPGAFLLDNTGQALGVTTDILNFSRSATTPDPGAYEFTVPPIDIGVSAIVSPNASGCYSASQSVIATVKNYGAASINFTSFPATVFCKITGTVTTTLSGALTGTLAPNATVNITLTPTVNMTANGSYSLQAYTVMSSDPNSSNDTLQTFVTTVGVLSGTISSSHNTICVSATPTLTLTGAYGGSIQWQQSTFGTSGPWSNVGSGGTTYTPSAPVTQTTHYRAIVSCNSNTATATVLTIIVNNPQISGTSPGSRCGAGTVTLGATPNSGTVKWYAAPSGGSALGSGNSFTTPVINNTTTYYAAAQEGGGGPGIADVGTATTTIGGNTGNPYRTSAGGSLEIRTQLLVLASELQAAGFTSAGDITSLGFTTTSVAGTVINFTIKLGHTSATVLTSTYETTPTTTVFTQATFSPALGLNTHTFSTPFTWNGSSNLLVEVCQQQSVTGTTVVSASTPPATANIGNAVAGGCSALTGTTTTGRAIMQFGFVQGCEGVRVPVTATIVPAPAINVTAADAAVCSGGSTTISVSSPNDPNYTYTWSSNPAGFSATGNGPHTVSPVVTTTYSVSAIDNSGLANDGCTISGTVEVVTGPVLAAGILSAPNQTFCESGTPVLTLSGSTGGLIQWQQSTTSSSGPWTNIGNGSTTYTPPSALTVTTYFQVVTSCTGSSVNSNVVTITINNPQIATTTPGSRCGTGTVTLGATAASGTVKWYANASGGTSIGSGNSFVTPVISSPTTFYATAQVGGGSGPGFADVGTATTTIGGNTGNPYRSGTVIGNEVRTQLLVLASELQAAGFTGAGDINSLAFTTTGAAGTVINFVIKLGHTNATVLTSTYETTPLTTVFTQASFSPAVGLNTHNFSTPFFWNGTSNLLVEVCQQNSVTGTTTVSASTPPATANIGNTAVGGCTAATGTTTTGRAIMKFGFTQGCEGTRVPVLANVTPAPAITATTSNATLCNGSSANLNATSGNAGYSYEWTPGNLSGASQSVTPSASTLYTVTATDNSGGANDGCVNVKTVQVNVQPGGITVSASPAEICASGTSTLSLEPATGYAANSIQWQSSSNNINFFDISGATAASYTTPTLTNTTVYYRAVVRDGLGAICANPSVTVSASTPDVLSSTGATRCGTGPVTLSATGTGAGTLKWFNTPVGGNPLASGSSYSPNVSASTTYYVEQSFGTTGGTPLVISEIDLGTNDQLEIMNVSGQTMDVTGWKVAISDSYTDITAVNSIVQVLSGTMAPGAMKTWTDLSSASNYWGSNMFWNPGAFPSFSGWAAILDNNNTLVDIVFMNWPAANINAASITVGSVTITGSSKWSGDGVNITTVPATQSVSRQGSSDNNVATDFIIQNLSVGTLNPGMTTPFTGFGCVSSRDAVPVVVNAAPTVTPSATSTLVCPGSLSTLSAVSSNPAYSYTWTPGNLTGSSVNVNPQFQTIYTVSAHDGTSGTFAGCDYSTTITVSTKPKIFATAAATPNFVCSGDNSSLSAFANTTSQYLLTGGTPSPVTVPGSGVTILDKNESVDLGDLDDGAWLINLPFAISFFGEQYDKMYVGTNGYVSFLNGYAGNTPPVLPAAAVPNNAIYLAEYDWDYRATGEIKYFVKGTAPNRSFVLHYENVPQFNGAVGAFLNGQIVIDEISGKITLLLITAGASTVKTVGIENATGTLAYAPASRNGTTWTLSTPESWEFDPAALGGSFTYAWTPTTFLDDATSQTPIATGITTSTTYTVTVTSNVTGCSNFDTTSVVTGAPLVVTSTVSQSTICAGNSSQLEVFPTGGCAPYTFTWDDGTNVLGNTSALTVVPSTTTTYYCTVMDNASNLEIVSLTITVNPTPLVTVNPGLICGFGTATLTATSDLAGTTFGWSPSTALNVTSGPTVITSTNVTRTYTVTGTSPAGCPDTAQSIVTIAFPTSVTASATPASVCLNGNSQLNAIGSSGNTLLITDILWNKVSPGQGVIPSYATSGADLTEISNVSNNPIDVSGYIVQSCTSNAATMSHSRALPPGTIIPAQGTLLICFGTGTDSPGNNFYFTGGTNDEMQSGTAAGAGVVIKDPNGVILDAFCYLNTGTFIWPAASGVTTADWTGTLNGTSAQAGAVRTAPIDHNNPTDWTIATASPTLTLAVYNTTVGYLPPASTIDYSWTPSTYLDSTTIANPLASNMGASIVYTVTATNSDGCFDTAHVAVTVGAPLSVTTSTSANNFCEDGSTTLNSVISGGGIPYSYSWSDGTSVVGTTASVTLDPPAGTTTYTLTVTDACNSTASSSVSVTVLPKPTLTVTKSGDICGTGSVTLTASGSGISYAWTPTTNLSPTTGPVVVASPTVNTLYSVTSTGSNTCTTVGTIQVMVSVLPNVLATATPANICAGGTSQLNAVGTLPSDPASFYSLTPLTSQTYAPLSGPGITTINTTAQLTTWLTSNSDDGGVLITLPFTFNYLGSPFTQMTMCTNGWVGAGNHVATAVTAAQSRAAANLWVSTLPNNVIAAWMKDMGANFPTGTGSMRHGLIGTDIYAFQWNNAVGSGFSDGSTNTISFQINIYGPASSAPGRIEYVYGPQVNTLATAAAIGLEDGIGGTNHYLNALTGTGTATTTSTAWPGNGNGYRFDVNPVSLAYSWAPATFLNNTSISNPVASNVTSTTTYAVTVTNQASGCFRTSPVTVFVEPLVATATISQSAICAGTNDTLRVTTTGGSSPYSFTWSTGGSDIGTGAQLIVNPVTTTTYTVTATDGCGNSDDHTVTVTVNPLPVLVVTPPGGAVCDGVPAGGITMTASGATTYAWSPAQGLSATTGATVTASGAASFATMTYTVVGTITATGCVSSETVTVYRNTYLTNVAAAVPGAICEDETSDLSSVFTIRTNPALLITEVTQFGGASTGQTSPRPSYFAASDDDFVEISNLSSSAINAGGLVFELWVGTLLNRSYTIPAGVIIPSNGTLVLHIGTGTDVPASNYYHTGGTNNPLGSTTAYGYILKSGASILDAVATTSSGGVTYNWPVGSGVVAASQWSGTITFAASVAGAIRIGGYDNNTAADWVYASNTNRQTLGTYNPIYASSSQPAFLYSWSPTSFLDDATLQNPEVSNATPGNYTYTVTATIPGSGCAKTASTNLTVWPLPTAVISGTADICVGSSVTLNFAFTGNAPYSYSFTDGTSTYGPFSSASNSATRTITPVGSGSDVLTYTLVGVSDAHCTGTVSGSAVITFDQVAPTLSACPADFAMCNPVTWTPPTASDNCSGVVRTSNYAPGATFPSGTTTVIYTATDANGNTATCSFQVTLEEPSDLSGITLTSNKPFNNICVGDNVTISMNDVAPGSLGTGAHWKWYSGTCGGTPVPGSTDQLSITVSPTTSTTYFVRAEGVCNITPCLSLPVTVSTAPPSGNPGIAYYPVVAYAGTTDSLVMNPVPGATFYSWSVSGNSNILFNGQVPPYQTSSPKVTVTFVNPATSGNGIGNYHIQFFAGNACGITNNNNVRIRATVEAPTTVTGSLVACVGQTRTYTVSPVVGAKTYQWNFASGTGTITGNGTQTVNVTFTSLPAVLCVHGVTAFGSPGPDLCLNISTITATPGPISGNALPCQGGTETYTILPVAGAVSYTWSTTIGGATINPSGTGLSATVIYPPGTFSGDLCVSAYSGCANSPLSCLPIVSGTVPPLGNITGTEVGVCGATSVNYQVGSTGATNYTWSVPAGANITAGQGTNSILVDFDTTYGGGNITVVSTNACGTVNGSLPVTGAPPMPVFTISTNSACIDDVFEYAASSPGATNYNWTVIGGNIIATANPDDILVEWTSNGGTVSVTAENSCGNSAPAVLNVSSSCRIAGDKKMAELLDAEVFPNPTQGRITLRYNSPEQAGYRMKITDMTGRTVRQESLAAEEGLNQKDIDLSHVAKGVYMLTLEQGGSKLVLRIVVE